MPKKGYKFTAKHKLNLARSARRVKSKQHKENISLAMTGRRLTEKTKKIMRGIAARRRHHAKAYEKHYRECSGEYTYRTKKNLNYPKTCGRCGIEIKRK